MTIIRKCTCKHDFQDRVYGYMMRVWNVSQKSKTIRCTVCGTTKIREGK